MIMPTATKVSDVMSKVVLVAKPKHSFLQLCRLFLEMDIHHLPVMDDKEQIIGMLSANDVLRAFTFQLPLLPKVDEATLNDLFPVEELMTPNPLITITPGASLAEATRRFYQHNVQALPVLDDGRLVGIITSRDIVKIMGQRED